MRLRQLASLTLSFGWLVAVSGCDNQFPVAGKAPVVPDIPGPEVAKNIEGRDEKVKEGCRVAGRVISKEWRAVAGGIERAIVTASTVPGMQQVADVYGEGGRFELQLPPGKYRVSFSANGTRGATFNGQDREIVVARDQRELDLGEIDLPISKTTRLYGRMAPDLTGIIGWQNTAPLALQELRGKVIVLDFFADYCSICHAHKPDLEKLRQKYGREGLVVLPIHDSTIKSIDEMNEKMEPILRHVFHGDPPRIPMALDSKGENSVCQAYGVYAVPAVILIDQQGKVVRRYHHAGKPELEADVQLLLAKNARRF